MPRMLWMVLVVWIAAGQTQIDLSTQAKNVPIKAGTSLPSTCAVGQIFFMTSAPTGANLYGCTAVNTWSAQGGQPGAGAMMQGTLASMPATCTVGQTYFATDASAGANLYGCPTANTWVSEGGSQTIDSNGVTVGSRPTTNFLTGAGLISVITDTGTEINIQSALDTAIVATLPAEQTGYDLLCSADSGSATTYECSMTPTATAYATGMVLHWIPDVNGAGGATTLNVDSLGATRVKEADGVTDPSATDIVAGSMREVWYDGVGFRLLGTGSGLVQSVFGRTGTVAAAAGDYVAAQITNAAATNSSNTFTAGTQDFSGAAHTRPAIVVATAGALPATCAAGELGFVTGATAGQQIYECSSPNTWTQQVAGGTSTPYVSLPYLSDSGSGTETSPWINPSDSTAGIQTSINSLAAVRGGLVSLAPGRHDIATSIVLTASDSGISLKGIVSGTQSQPNDEAVGIWATKIRSTQPSGNMLEVDYSGGVSGRPGGIHIQDLYMWGYGVTPASNAACIALNGPNGSTRLENLRLGNCGDGIYAVSGDGLRITGNEMIHDGYPLLLNGNGFWFSTIDNNIIGDNNYNVSITDTGNLEFIQFHDNHLVRNCRSASCTSNPSDLFWSVSNSLIQNNVSSDAGICETFGQGCSANNPAPADEFAIAGSQNTISGNSITRTTAQPGACGIRVLSGANGNIIADNTFLNEATDICVMSGAADTQIRQTNATISDSGTRTVINGVSANAGDPNSSGNWNGAAKWAGLIINDTTDNVQWLYYTPTARLQLVAGSSSSNGIAHVQSCSNNITAAGTIPSISCTFSTAVTAGNFIHVCVSTVGSQTVTWSGDNGTFVKYINNVGTTSGANYQSNCAYVASAGGGETVIRAAFTQTTNPYPSISGEEFSGVLQTSPLDVDNLTGNGDSSAIVSGSVTPGASGELIIAYGTQDMNGSLSAGAGFVSGDPTSGTGGIAEYALQNTAGAITAPFATGMSGYWIATIAAFKHQ
ncbi:MAG: hypothetical protein WBL61_05470 [Bryobacteraceae bacterium]